MSRFIIDHINEGDLPFLNDDGAKQRISIIDLGTGNGHLLFQLQEDLEEECEVNNLEINFEGIDYSPDSVKFAKSIQKRKELQNFKFEQADLLAKENEYLSRNAEKFDILLDKGTLDAIALNNEPMSDFDGKIGLEIYSSQISKIMKHNSIFLITSCNFTEDELIKIITENNTNKLKVWNKINYKTFQFGGVNGSTICSIAFVKQV